MAVIVILDLLEFTANVKVSQVKNNSLKTSALGAFKNDRYIMYFEHISAIEVQYRKVLE